ncbi:hypothetical protein CALCODRAFT_554132 [Calocera cornea HHB12733]|uniref:F-box domain-containing protein n=1 Tax=Calocera cornea HHB12733 TaxID=1353952 RepID=A0A165HSG8_9BASI|nr:hypothetical protein CALCODRAFT_554132 [Calocera cornea HHB12733]
MQLNDLPPELLQLVISYLSPSSSFAVALTCHLLHDIAIQHVWEAPRTLALVTVGDRPDARLLRGTDKRTGWVASKVRRAIGIRSRKDEERVPLSLLKARRFEFYASFVRSLVLDETQGDTLSLDLVNAQLRHLRLSSFPSALPRLRELTLRGRPVFIKSACSLPWHLCSLSYVKVSVQLGLLRGNEHTQPPGLPATLTLLPRLDELEVMRQRWKGEERGIFDVLSKQFGESLKLVTLVGLDFDARVLRPPLPALQDLNLMIDTDAHIPPELSMLALKNLHLMPIDHISGSQAFLAALDAPELKGISLTVGFLSALEPWDHEGDPPERDPLLDLLSLIARKWPRLTEFSLHISEMHRPPLDLEASACWSLTRLRPLLLLPLLTEVDIVTPALVSLSDADIATIAHSWPEVRALSLRGAVGERAASWSALSVLAQLPNLQELALPIVFRTPSSPIPSGWFSHVEKLNMGQGDVAFPDHTAKGLNALFPSLKTIEFDNRPGHHPRGDEIARAGRLMRLKLALEAEPEVRRRREKKLPVNPWERSGGRIGTRESMEVGWPR